MNGLKQRDRWLGFKVKLWKLNGHDQTRKTRACSEHSKVRLEVEASTIVQKTCFSSENLI